MTRKQAFINVRKYHFKDLLINENVGYRRAWIMASNRAAYYTFKLSEHDLKYVSVAVW